MATTGRTSRRAIAEEPRMHTNLDRPERRKRSDARGLPHRSSRHVLKVDHTCGVMHEQHQRAHGLNAATRARRL